MSPEKKELDRVSHSFKKSNSKEDIINESLDQSIEKYDTPPKEEKYEHRDKQAISKKLDMEERF